MAKKRNRQKEGFERGSFTRKNKKYNKFEDYGEDVNNAVKKVLQEKVEEIVAEAKERCPERTGKLKNSIKGKPNKDRTLWTVKADARNKKDGEYYGQYVEFSPKILEPFLYPAFEAHKDEIPQAVIAAIQKAVKQS